MFRVGGTINPWDFFPPHQGEELTPSPSLSPASGRQAVGERDESLIRKSRMGAEPHSARQRKYRGSTEKGLGNPSRAWSTTALYNDVVVAGFPRSEDFLAGEIERSFERGVPGLATRRLKRPAALLIKEKQPRGRNLSGLSMIYKISRC